MKNSKKKHGGKSRANITQLVKKAPKDSVVIADLQNGGGPTDFVRSFRETKK